MLFSKQTITSYWNLTVFVIQGCDRERLVVLIRCSEEDSQTLHTTICYKFVNTWRTYSTLRSHTRTACMETVLKNEHWTVDYYRSGLLVFKIKVQRPDNFAGKQLFVYHLSSMIETSPLLFFKKFETLNDVWKLKRKDNGIVSVIYDICFLFYSNRVKGRSIVRPLRIMRTDNLVSAVDSMDQSYWLEIKSITLPHESYKERHLSVVCPAIDNVVYYWYFTHNESIVSVKERL